jgi:hypothetical protein
MRKSLLLAVLLTFSSLVFAAKSYDLTFNSPTKVAGVEFHSGTYSMRVAGDKVIFKDSQSKEVSVPAKSENGARKFDYTYVESSAKDGKETVKMIHLAGSNTTLEFGD